MLEARSLTKYYAAVPAIRDVSFRVDPGGILGLLGPNGSGKSTTVSILTGLLEPSGGSVLFHGKPIRDELLDYKARIGYVPEEGVLYSYLTGPEYLSLVGGLRGIPSRRLNRKIDGFLQLFGLQDDVDAPM
jgi:ABC-2 type transport system ATP-binding protein